jgi:sec-independent protein translocase protein TatC
MLLTPPDIISQTLLALPMWVLYEIGIIVASIMQKKDGETDGESAETSE